MLTAASLDIAVGKKLFERNWVSAPSSTKSDDGLGPLYDAPSCAACHAANASAELDETEIAKINFDIGRAENLGLVDAAM